MITKYKVNPQSGQQTVLPIGRKGAAWLGLEILRLEKGETWGGELKDEECALVPLSGRCTVELGDKAKWSGVGGRPDIFTSPPFAAYVPRRSAMEGCGGIVLEPVPRQAEHLEDVLTHSQQVIPKSLRRQFRKRHCHGAPPSPRCLRARLASSAG